MPVEKLLEAEEGMWRSGRHPRACRPRLPSHASLNAGGEQGLGLTWQAVSGYTSAKALPNCGPARTCCCQCCQLRRSSP